MCESIKSRSRHPLITNCDLRQVTSPLVPLLSHPKNGDSCVHPIGLFFRLNKLMHLKQ